MEPTEVKPGRRRRWWIVAAVLAVGFFSWWNWPRGDARLIGKWQFWAGSPPVQRATWEFRWNGSGVSRDPNRKGNRSGNVSFPWAVEDGHLLIGYRQKIVENALVPIGALSGRYLGVFLFFPEPLTKWRIISSSRDTIVLESPFSSTEQMTLKRTPTD